MEFKRIVAALMAIVLLPGCATRTVYFTSEPPGARVTVGQITGTTPCTLKVPEGVESALFRLPSGEEMSRPIPEMDDALENTAELGGKAVGGTMMVAGGVLALLGILVIISGSPDSDDRDDYINDTQESEWDWESVGYGVLGLAVGGGVFFAGDWIYPDDDDPILHAEFNIASDETEQKE